MAGKPEPRCSFCAQSPRQVGPLVEGCGVNNLGGVFICHSCVKRLAGVFEADARRSPGPVARELQALQERRRQAKDADPPPSERP
jgi:hypothetical protein